MTIQPANSISWSGGVAVPDEQLGVQKLDEAMNALTDLLGELELEFTDAPIATKKDAKSTGTLDTALSVLHQQLAELENDLRKRSQVAESVSQSLDLASTQPAIVQETSHLKVGDNREILAKVLPTPPPQPAAICQRSQSPSGWTWRLPPGTQQFVPSPRHSMTNSPGALAARQPRGQVLMVQPQAQVPQTMPLQRSSTPMAPKDAWSKPVSPAQAMANAAISATANLAPTAPATAPVLGRALSPAPGVGARPTPLPFVPASCCWRSPSEGRVPGAFGIRPDAQSPMRRRQEEMPSPASRQGFRSPSPRQSGRGGTPGFGTTTTSPCNISRAGRSPSEGRVTYGGSVPRGAWARGDPRSSFRREATTGAHSFNLCQSASMTSSHPSFCASQSVMGGGGFNTAPAPAASYIVDLADPIDQMLGNALRSLDAAAASKLMLRRLAPGRYEIDGRKVTVRWSEQGAGLVAIEDEVLDPRGSAMPLRAYLGQAGNVVASLSGQRADMPKIARVPKSQRLTFDDKQAEKNLAAQIEKLGSERCESMRLAVEQARLREEAAEAYEKLTQGFAPSRILAPSPPANRMSL